MLNLCTLFDSQYLAKGLALVHSLHEHHGDLFRLNVLALDDTTERELNSLFDPCVRVFTLRDIITLELADAKNNRTWTEFCWTLASFFTRYCLEMLGIPEIAYVDADMFLLHPLDSLYREVAQASVAITPHRFSPARAKTHGVNGTYNVGWVYFKNDVQGRACLAEWVSLCLKWCYRRSEQSADSSFRFGDQAYWDQLVPKFGVQVVKHLGVNLAPWNCANYEYQMALDDHSGCRRLFVIERSEQGGVKRIDIASLYHFHSLQDTDGRVLKPSDYPIPPMVAQHIYEPYAAVLQQAGKRK